MARIYVPVDPEQFHHQDGLDHWEYSGDSLVANFRLSTLQLLESLHVPLPSLQMPLTIILTLTFDIQEP